MPDSNVYLIGYRCTGKTTLGAALAQRLQWRFVDMDDAIVEASGITIADMVARHGWPFFREKEKRLLRELAARRQTVVGTGGGVVLDNANIEAMRASGRTIWVRSRPETIRRYIAADERTESLRPALTDKGLLAEIETVLDEREPLYRRAADIIVDTDEFDIEALCSLMINLLEQTGLNEEKT